MQKTNLSEMTQEILQEVKILTIDNEMSYLRTKEEVTKQDTIYTDLTENKTTAKYKHLIPQTIFDCLLCHNMFKDSQELL